MYQFHIHPNINPNVALSFDIAILELNTLPALPNDWLEQLVRFDKNNPVDFLEALKKQFGEESIYSKAPLWTYRSFMVQVAEL